MRLERPSQIPPKKNTFTLLIFQEILVMLDQPDIVDEKGVKLLVVTSKKLLSVMKKQMHLQ